MAVAVTGYSEIRGKLKTGDLVLMAGDSLFSTAIKMFSKGSWSHVGMVLRSEKPDMVMLWESTLPTKARDVDTGKFLMGVQTVLLSERIKTYEGKFCVRQSNRELNPKEQKKDV